MTVRLRRDLYRGIEIGERHGVLATGMISREGTAASRSARGASRSRRQTSRGRGRRGGHGGRRGEIPDPARGEVTRPGISPRLPHPAATATTPQELRVRVRVRARVRVRVRVRSGLGPGLGIAKAGPALGRPTPMEESLPRVSKGVVSSGRKCAREPFGEESSGEEGGCKDG